MTILKTTSQSEICSTESSFDAHAAHFAVINGAVLITLKTKAGDDLASFTMKPGAFMNAINSSVIAMNQNLPPFLKELGGF